MTDWQPDTSDEWTEIPTIDEARAMLRMSTTVKPQRDYLTTCEHKVVDFLRTLQAQHANPTPSAKYIAESIGYAIGSVRNALTSLEKRGRIEKQTKGYHLAPQRVVIQSLNKSEHISISGKTCSVGAKWDTDEGVWCSSDYPHDAHYWQFMEQIERNTTAWCKARRAQISAPPAPIVPVVDITQCNPEFAACFFWDDTHEQAA